MAFKVFKNAPTDDVSLIQRMYAALRNDAGESWDAKLFDNMYPELAGSELDIQEKLSKRMPKAKRASLESELADIGARRASLSDALATNPLKTKVELDDGSVINPLANTANLAGNWMSNHKLKTAGLAGTGLMNLAGLFDNDKIVGQGLGLGAGFAAGKILPGLLKTNPLTGSGLALATMAGGSLGSLFDKLMAKKAEEEAAVQAAYAEQY